MNWYFEKDGVSQGPHSEEELEALVRSGTVAAHHLIWQVGMENWDSVQLLRPQWLQSASPTGARVIEAEPEPGPLSEPAETPAAKPKRERAVSTAKPATSRLRATPAKPEADTSAAAEPPPKTGILKRLFGKK
jgi:GYF domain 2